MIKAIALDDEPLSLEITKSYCDQIDSITLLNTFTSQKKALDFLREHPVDLIFLDIEMPESNGMNLYKTIHKKVKVVFTTAHKTYAVEAFNVSAIDYLLKPFSFDRFLSAVEKVKKEFLPNNQDNTTPTHIDIKADYQVYRVPLEDIVYIEAFDDYIIIHLTNASKIVARYTMKGILERLPENQFIRIHRSYITALDKITSIQKNKLQIGDTTLAVSTTYKDKLLEKFNP